MLFERLFLIESLKYLLRLRAGYFASIRLGLPRTTRNSRHRKEKLSQNPIGCDKINQLGDLTMKYKQV